MNDYPPEWPAIALEIKQRADWKCVRCGHDNDRESGHVLTVHHLDMDKANCQWWNCPALCQRCHLSVQSRVRMGQAWMFPALHSPWFLPYLAGRLYAAESHAGEDYVREHACSIIARHDTESSRTAPEGVG